MSVTGSGITFAPAGTAMVEFAPGIYATQQPDPSTGCYIYTNTTASVASFPMHGNQMLNIPAATTVYVQPSPAGGPYTITTAPTTTGGLWTIGVAGVGGAGGGGAGGSFTAYGGVGGPVFAGPSGSVPSGLNDPLMPRDELVFSTNPLTLTEDNKKAIRAFVMEIPSLAKIVKAALEKIRAIRDKMAEAKRAAEEIERVSAFQALSTYANLFSSKPPPPYETDIMRRYCDEHDQQVKQLLKTQEAKYRKSLKWISTFPGSRTFADA